MGDWPREPKMQRFIILRVLQAILTIVAVSVVIFSLARLSGDPVDVLAPLEATPAQIEAIRAKWGLDRPVVEQYFVFMGNALQGDFGTSFRWRGQDTLDLVLSRIPATLQLAAFALGVSVVLAIPIGVLSAVKKDTPVDFSGKVIALLGQSLPTFWIGIVLIWIFAVKLDVLPVSGRGGITHMIMPGITLGWFQVAAVMRLTRSSMLEVLDSEYVKLARIKGLSETRVIWKHCLRNAAIAPLTYFGIIAGILLTGSVVTEQVFSWPGVGLLAINAIRSRDFAVVQTVVMLFSFIFVISNLVVDIAYAYLDPRIRYR